MIFGRRRRSSVAPKTLRPRKTTTIFPNMVFASLSSFNPSTRPRPGLRPRPRLAWLGALALGLGLGSVALPLRAQPMMGGARGQMPGMPDPRMMSGISRVDSGLEAGAISVRALLGSFAQPAVGTTIKLELFSAKGESLGTKTMVSDEAGRVTFRELSSVGEVAYAIAKATLGEQEEQSRKIAVDPRAGSRVLLVKGAGAWQKAKGAADGAANGAGGMPGSAAGGAPGMMPPHGSAARPSDPHGAVAGGHGGAAHGAGAAKAPALCKPNPLDTHPDGTLVVGLIQFSSAGELVGRKDETIHLEIKAPGLAPKRLESKTQADGRVVFQGLLASAYPPGTRMKLWAAADPKAPPPRPLQSGARVALDVPAGKVRIKALKPGARRLESEEFSWDGKAAVVLLTRTCDRAAKEAVQDLQVQLWRHTMTGEKESVAGHIDQSASVLLAPKQVQDGDFFSVQGVYKGAPYRTNFFNLPPQGGVEVELVVYETTRDPSVLRSMTQLEFHPREDNMLQVNHYFQTYVTGNKAFWWPDLKIEGPSDTRWFQVVPGADAYLDHKEEAPYATLARPLVPGTPIDLSVAYGVPHDGSRRIEWTSPFPLERAMGVSDDKIRFASGALAPMSDANHQGPSSKKLYSLSIAGDPPRLCQDPSEPCKLAEPQAATLDLLVEGIAYQRPWLRIAGIAAAVLAALGIGVGMLGRRRLDPLAELIQERDRLWRQLQELELQGEEAEASPQRQAQKEAVLQALNSIYHRIEARLASQSKQSPTSGPASGSAPASKSAAPSRPPEGR